MPTVLCTLPVPVPPEAVWSVLCDTAHWSRWNPAQPYFRGPATVGAPIQIAVKLGPLTVPFPARVQHASIAAGLWWTGGTRLLFHAVHGITVKATAEGSVIVQEERFSGPLAWLLWPVMKTMLHAAYAAANAGLAAAAVQQHKNTTQQL